MKIYARYENEICELLFYKNTKSFVEIKSPSEGFLRVEKRNVEIVGFKNGKGDTGELKILDEDSYKKGFEDGKNEMWSQIYDPLYER